MLALLIITLLSLGLGDLSKTFLTNPPDPDPVVAGFYPAIMGSIWLLVLVPLLALPAGVATAIILEEFTPRKPVLKRIHSVLQLNITNLAGVPSVVYGIIGLTIFVSMFGFAGRDGQSLVEWGIRSFDQFYSETDQVLLVPVAGPNAPESELSDGLMALTTAGEEVRIHVIGENAPWPEDPALSLRTLRDYDTPGRIHERSWYYFRIPFGRGVLTGALTLVLVILPVIIIATQEALRAVPHSLREAAWGLGLSRWQTVWRVVFPSALPTVMTGTILAISRAVGEAAPLLMIAGIVFITNPPGNIMDDFTAMPLQIYNWAQRPQKEFHDLAASGIVVLLTILLCFNAIAIIIRNRSNKARS
jgi:phosphate transport system permease protein